MHGPLSALMLLETTMFCNPDINLKSFEYRARNPLVANQTLTINGTWKDNTADLWCVNEKGVVGMTGTVEVFSHVI